MTHPRRKKVPHVSAEPVPRRLSPEPEVEVEHVEHVLQVDEVEDGGRRGERPADVRAQPVHGDGLVTAVLASKLHPTARHSGVTASHAGRRRDAEEGEDDTVS